MCPKWFLSLWYVWRKPCTYLAPTLTLSLNRPKWHSTRPTSPRSSVGSVQNDFWACVCSVQTMHLSCVKITTLSRQTELSFCLSLITLGCHQVRPKWFLTLWYVWHKPCIYLAPTLALSKNGPKRGSTRPTSSRSSIGCVQNNFRVYGTFGTNMASILHQD
jgi:hypothetical protein